MRGRKKVLAEERFKKLLSVNNTGILAKNKCWIWSSTNNSGYGTFRDGTGKQGLAHRWSYSTFVGPIPENLLVTHQCDNRKCVNPNHLSVASYAGNSAQMVLRGRSSRVADRKPKVPLSIEQKSWAIYAYMVAGWNLNRIAVSLGRDRTHIQNVIETYLRKHRPHLIQTLEKASAQLTANTNMGDVHGND